LSRRIFDHRTNSSAVMPALVAGIHVFVRRMKDVDGLHYAGHDGPGARQFARGKE
jgi:hypothetical protein